MVANDLMNLLNELRKRDTMRGLPFYEFNNTGAEMLFY